MTFFLTLEAKIFPHLNNWINCEEPHAFKKHILSRVVNLVLAPLSGLAALGDTLIGAGGGIASILTLGKHRKIWKFADKNLQICSTLILTLPYMHLLTALNLHPNTGNGSDEPPLIRYQGAGFIFEKLVTPLIRTGNAYSKSNNFIQRHVTSRLIYSLAALAALVARLADGVIALGVTPLSFITLGKIASINNLAYRTLQFPSLIHDLWYCSIKILNPQAGIE